MNYTNRFEISRFRLFLMCTLIFALTGCFGSPTTISCAENCVITQEEVQGNARWNDAYQPFFDIKTEGAIIPGLRQGFVPQAIDYIPEYDWLVMSGHRDGDPSWVLIVHGETGEFIKSLQFKEKNSSIYTGHAGGVAVSKQHLWISSGGRLRYVALDDVVAAPNGSTLTFAGSVPVDARGSFVHINDDIVWVGDFAHRPNYETEKHHELINLVNKRHYGWIAGYTLDERTDLIEPRPISPQDGAYIPDFVLSIPDKIQELTIIDDRIILTESYGRNNPSHFYIYENPLLKPAHEETTIGKTKVPVWFLDDTNKLNTWTTPPMAEGLAIRDNELHLIFESAALKFLNGQYALSRLQVVPIEDFIY